MPSLLYLSGPRSKTRARATSEDASQYPGAAGGGHMADREQGASSPRCAALPVGPCPSVNSRGQSSSKHRTIVVRWQDGSDGTTAHSSRLWSLDAANRRRTGATLLH